MAPAILNSSGEKIKAVSSRLHCAGQPAISHSAGDIPKPHSNNCRHEWYSRVNRAERTRIARAQLGEEGGNRTPATADFPVFPPFVPVLVSGCLPQLTAPSPQPARACAPLPSPPTPAPTNKTSQPLCRLFFLPLETKDCSPLPRACSSAQRSGEMTNGHPHSESCSPSVRRFLLLPPLLLIKCHVAWPLIIF